jgi:hypothetical protein
MPGRADAEHRLVVMEVYARGMVIGNVFWSTLAFFFLFSVVALLVSVFGAIMRRDMSDWAKAGWIILVVLMPFLGSLIYLISQPRTLAPASEADDDSPAPDRAAPERHTDYRPADEIATAARLHDVGRISSTEFEYLKQEAMSRR